MSEERSESVLISGRVEIPRVPLTDVGSDVKLKREAGWVKGREEISTRVLVGDYLKNVRLDCQTKNPWVVFCCKLRIEVSISVYDSEIYFTSLRHISMYVVFFYTDISRFYMVLHFYYVLKFQVLSQRERMTIFRTLTKCKVLKQ